MDTQENASPARSTMFSAGRASSPKGLGGKWESDAVSEVQQLRAQLRWKRGYVPALALLSFVVGLVALNLTWPNAMPPVTLEEGLLCIGGAVLASGCWWFTLGLLWRYLLPTPLPPHLTARQRVLLGLPPANSDEDNHRKPAPSRAASGADGCAEPHPVTSMSPASPLRYRSPASASSSYYSTPTAASPVQRDLLHRQVLTRRRHPLSPEVTITDQRALDRHLLRSPLAAERSGESASVGLPEGATGASGAAATGLAVRPLYHVSPRSSPAKGPAGDKFGYFNTQAAQELVDRLGVEGSLDEWTERMRQWLLEHVLWPLVRDIREVTKAGLPLTKPLTQANSTASQGPSLTSSAPTSMWYSFQSAPQPTTSSFSQNPVVQKRQMLEKYMDVHGSPSREYIVQRIKELAEGGCMAAFKWDGGGSWQGKPWSTELPTDSQILIHVFCAHMDDLLPADPRADKSKPFSSLYYVLAPKSPEGVPTAAKIYQTHVHPPRFKVLVQQGEVWDTFQGRNNLFHALCLWAFAVQTKLDGFIGQVHLSETGLDRVIRVDI